MDLGCISPPIPIPHSDCAFPMEARWLMHERGPRISDPYASYNYDDEDDDDDEDIFLFEK